MIQAYVTSPESDVYLAGKADWLALDDAVKDAHLSWGRVWIDSEYLCAYTEVDATDNIKYANSLAGYADFKGTLYADTATLESTSVTAGSVTSSKTFANGYKQSDPTLDQAGALLNYDCDAIKTSTGSVPLSRV